MNRRSAAIMEKMYKNAVAPEDYFAAYSQYLASLLMSLDMKAITKATELISLSSKKGKSIYLIGNGGSAATASHFATDLAHCGIIGYHPLAKSLSFTDNVALLTAIANDQGYDDVFSHQVETHIEKGDVLIAISASGNSPNVLRAVEKARVLGAKIIGLVGFDGGILLRLCDVAIHVKTEKGAYGPCEDIHMCLDHMITSYLAFSLSAKKKSIIKHSTS